MEYAGAGTQHDLEIALVLGSALWRVLHALLQRPRS